MLSLVIYDQGKESIKDHFTHTMLFGESPRSHEKQNFTLAPFKQRGCGVVYHRRQYILSSVDQFHGYAVDHAYAVDHDHACAAPPTSRGA